VGGTGGKREGQISQPVLERPVTPAELKSKRTVVVGLKKMVRGGVEHKTEKRVGVWGGVPGAGPSDVRFLRKGGGKKKKKN